MSAVMQPESQPSRIYTRNASDRMAEWHISTEQVEHVLGQGRPASTTNGGAAIYSGNVDGRHLSVVIEGDASGTVLTLWDESAS